MKAMVEQFAEVCRKRGLKVGAGEEVQIDGIRLEHVLEFKYLWCVLDNQVQMGQSVVERWRMGGRLQVP